MKIAYLCNIYPAPTHTFIRREIGGLERAGIEVERLTIRRSTDALDTPEDQLELQLTFAVLEQGIMNLLGSVFVIALKRPKEMMRAIWTTMRLGARSQSGVIKHFAYLVEACVLVRYTGQKGISHIHAHFGTNATTVAMFIRKLGGPTYSFMIHGPLEWDCPEFLHLPQKVEEAEFVTAISDFAKSQTYRWTKPEHWKKVHVIRCGVDDEFISQNVVPVPDVSRLVMIGRLGPPKGHVILLEALQRLLDKGVSFHMLLIGDGPMRELIQEQISDLGLTEHVTLAGWMDNNLVRQELLASRGMVLPSFSEGLPVVIMEALAMARPVVCTRIAGISELVIDSENGWLVNAGNVDELADAINKLLDTPVKQLFEMGKHGREVVLEMHSSIAEAKKLAGILHTYCGR